MALQFDADAHAYQWDGQPVPSVTQILEPLNDFSGIPPNVLEAARVRGQWVHEMTERSDYETPIGSVPEPYTGYVLAWEKFKAETDYVPELIECRVFSEKYRYAGTFDRFCKLVRCNTILDVKATHAPPPSAAPQTAAYKQAFEEMTGRKVSKRFTLHLKGDGNYQLIEHKKAADLSVFLSCLTIHKWRIQNGK